ncbi:hypothetical protein HK099_007950 [Clydaea vesicula]|uniref:Probable glycerol kinase n=1 Tax=Clydaea vesicula TaxID=447962 RepID=A0AAD5TZC9_9FUNG|nr:hypothetical protein HK099_007950 [Clydaea vesicula]
MGFFNCTCADEEVSTRTPNMKPVKTFVAPFVGSIDQGTTSSRFIIFDKHGQVVALHQIEIQQITPKEGWTEHNPEEIYETTLTSIKGATDKFVALGYKISDIKSVGITNQRETTVVWGKSTGKSLHNAVVWLDTRTKSTVEKLVSKTKSKKTNEFVSIVGLPLSTYFSGVKLNWLLEHVPAVSEAKSNNNLLFGTIDSWLIYKLTGGLNGGKHLTDVTNASRTMLLNLETLQWDKKMLEFFDIPQNCLPEVRSSSEHYGNICEGILKGIPIAGVLGDQQAALVGQRCLKPGQVKNTYGTGCFTLFNTGNKTILSKNGLLTTVAYKLGPNAEPTYALEGSVATAGAGVKWLRDNLNMINDAKQINEFASKVPDTAGCHFVPAFSGLFAPYWKDDAKGCISGLTSFHTKHHICRALLEAICFQSKELVDAMNADAGQPLRSLKVDGGLTNSDLCMQIQADILGITVERPAMRESTALGAALAAGLSTGVWTSLDENVEGGFKLSDGHDYFESQILESDREVKFAAWKKAVEKSFAN